MNKEKAKAEFEKIDIAAWGGNSTLRIIGYAFTNQPCVVEFGKLWNGRVKARISYYSPSCTSYGLECFDGYGFDEAWQAVDEWIKGIEDRSMAPSP